MKSSKAFNTAVAAALVAAVALTACLMAFPQLLGGQSSAVAEAYEEMVFGTGGVLSVEISVKESDWETMLANATAEEYFACDVTVDGYTVSTAGIRCKGNSSLSSVFSSDSERYSFKVEFDHYDSSRSLYGLDKLALNDCYADATYMKEYLSYEMFRSLGIATPLCAFANITVNGEPWGLYLAVECVEESFALRNYGVTNVNLYKPEGDDMGRGGNFGGGMGGFDFSGAAERFGGNAELPEEMELPAGQQAPGAGAGEIPGGMSTTGGGSDLVYADDALESYPDIFDAQVLGDESNAAHRRVVAALKNLQEGKLEEAIDMDEVARYFAVNTVLVNLDHYTGSFKHNYYLLEKDGILSMLPWDYNLAFGGFGPNDAESAVNFPIDTPVSGTALEDRPMIGALLADDECLALYHSYIAQIEEEWLEPGILMKTIEDVAALIAPYVQEDATAFYTFDEFAAAVEALETFVALRGESLRGQLDGSIPATEEGQATQPDALVGAESLSMSDMGSQGGGQNDGGRGQGGFAGNGEGPGVEAQKRPAQQAPAT